MRSYHFRDGGAATRLRRARQRMTALAKRPIRGSSLARDRRCRAIAQRKGGGSREPCSELIFSPPGLFRYRRRKAKMAVAARAAMIRQ